MSKRQRAAVEVEVEDKETAIEETAVEETEEPKAKKQQAPLDRKKMKPEANEQLDLGEDAKIKLEVASEACSLLGLEKTAKRLWKEAERVYAATEREARRIQKAGSKEQRESAKKAKKAEKIAKLRKQLEALMAAETNVDE